TVTLTVTDNQGATGNVSHSVTVTAPPPPNQPPVAAFSSSCTQLTCNFTSTSSDPDGSVASYAWTFGDGGTASAQNPSHTYTAGGTFTVTRTVTDNQGATGNVSHSVTVTAPPPPNQPPVAAFTSSCTQLTCSFTSTSSDPDGSVASYAWTFGDNGTATTQNPSHTYTAGGTFTVTLTVTDNQSATNNVSHTVTVTAPPPLNQPPVAAFTSSCTQLTCNFTSTSSDPDGTIASYAWTFGDGATATTQNPSHTYLAGGTFTVTLTVTDNQSATGSVSHPVTVTAPPPPNQPPAAAFTSSCTQLTCSFTSTSSDPDGTISTYRWTFGDGTAAATAANPSHTYTAGGTYTVTLTVTDNQGATGSVSHSVTVTAPPPVNQPPVAAFTSSCTQLTCNFTSTSSDPDGSVASYAWTFGDGGTASAQNPSHTYTAGGTFTVTLTVTDNQGGTGNVSHTVTVTAPPPPNQPPVAAFTSSCTQLTCSFTSTSSDPDGTIAGYAWTFGDGGTASAQNPSHTYTAGGTFTVTLTVTDNQGATGSVSHSVTVTAPPPPNQPPVAAFTSSCTLLICTFTNASSDPDGSIAGYSWTFGDGTTSTDQNPSHVYTAGGTYTVTLTVTDNQGATGAVSHPVTVSTPPPPNQPPSATAGSDQTVLVGALFTLTGAGFSDPDHDGPWTVTIDWGDGTSSTSTSPSEGSIGGSHSYPVTLLAHDYQLTVTVVDAHGGRGSATKTVHVVLL
ncbi:MAG TPA: PKD domain-containing protein, partial [Gemmatimonadales bacterium]|nr:PKD domain-containing protein [Gemmatimonadales bacterium]